MLAQPVVFYDPDDSKHNLLYPAEYAEIRREDGAVSGP
jgi:hypothetical protein